VPTVVTTAATGVTRTAANVNGTVNPHGSATTVVFDYSTDPDLLGPLVVGTRKDGIASPQGTAVDSSGNVFVASRTAHKIVKITPAGVQTDFAGSGTAGFANGTGAAARFDNPSDVAIDSANNLYVADELNQRIRKITPAGVVSTIAGSGVAGFLDAATAVNGRFLFPCGVAVSADGSRVHVADRGNHRIRLITGGVLTTLAGDGVAGFANGPAATAQFNNPTGVAVDPFGNVFVADRDNHLVRVVNNTDEVLTFAGSGAPGFLDGDGASAQFRFPSGVATDGAGRVYVADRDNHRLRQIESDGVVSTTAGSGLAGILDSPAASFLYPATAAQFSSPNRVAVHPGTGSILMTEGGSQRVREVSRGGLLTIPLGPTYSGNAAVNVGALIPKTLLTGATYYFRIRGSNAQGPAEGAILSFTTPTEPQIALFDGATVASPQLFHAQAAPVDFGITPRDTPVTRQFTIANPGGWPLNVSTINVPAGYQRTGGIGVIAAGGTAVFSVTLTASAGGTFVGNVQFVSDDPLQGTFNLPITGVVLDPPGVTTVAASAVNATGATLNATVNPRGSDTTVWFEYSLDAQFDGVLVSTLAGGTPAYLEGTGTAARFNQPYGLAVDGAGNTYVADTLNHRIRRMTPSGDVSTIAGTGVAGFTNGPGALAQFDEPVGVVVGANGVLFVTDSKNHRIRSISATGDVTTHSGLGVAGFTDGVGAGARFSTPRGLAIDAAGILYVADRDNHRIRKVAADGSVTTLAGTGTAGSLNGVGNVAQFNGPVGIAVGASGIVFVTEAASHTVRQIQPNGTVSALAGSSATPGFADASGAAARFSSPVGVAVDGSGNVYVADKSNQRIRKITALGAVTTMAGTGVAGATDGIGEVAQFDSPVSVASIGIGRVLVGDLGYSTIRQIVPSSVVLEGATGLNGFTDITVALPVTGLTEGATYYFRAFATNGGGTTVDGILNFAPSPTVVSPFQAWQMAQFGTDSTNPLIAGALADPSKDGVVNLFKYAHLLNPNISSQAGLPVVGVSGGALTLTYTKVLSATDLTYTVEWSTDLVGWSTVGVSEVFVSGDATTELIRASVPVAGDPKKFIRLHLTLQQP
jgi:sugar lactone lactonase YvrE